MVTIFAHIRKLTLQMYPSRVVLRHSEESAFLQKEQLLQAARDETMQTHTRRFSAFHH